MGFISSARRLLFPLAERRIVEKYVARKKGVIYGSRSVAEQVPAIVAREPEDVDVFARKPAGFARGLARLLSRQSGETYRVAPAKHVGTYKVRRPGGTNVADITQMPTGGVSVVRVAGQRFSTLKFETSRREAIAQDPLASFRKAQAVDDLKRIRFAKKSVGVR